MRSTSDLRRLTSKLHAVPYYGLFAPAAAVLLFLGCGQHEPVAADPSPQPRLQSRERRASPAAQPRTYIEKPAESFALADEFESKLPIYDIKMREADLEAMDMNPRAEEMYPATFTANGVVYDNVKIRYRGQWARTWPKKPLKIFFNEDKPFEGQRRLNLNSSFRDPSFIRETLAYHIYRMSGAPASQSQLVRVHLNGEFRGLYVQVEQPDKAFLKRNDLKGVTIVKASSRMKEADERNHPTLEEFRMHYEQETQKEDEIYDELKKFCDELETSQNVFAFFEKNVDLPKYINYLAASALAQNWDGYNKNHFLIYDAKGSKKWFVLPWDLDRALGDHWDWSFGRADLPLELGTSELPAVTGWNRMLDRFMSDPQLRARLADRLEELIDKEFTPEKLDPVIDQLHAAIRTDAELDYRRWPNESGMTWWRNEKAGLDASVKIVKQFIRDRREFLRGEVARIRKQESSGKKARAAVQQP